MPASAAEAGARDGASAVGGEAEVAAVVDGDDAGVRRRPARPLHGVPVDAHAAAAREADPGVVMLAAAIDRSGRNSIATYEYEYEPLGWFG